MDLDYDQLSRLSSNSCHRRDPRDGPELGFTVQPRKRIPKERKSKRKKIREEKTPKVAQKRKYDNQRLKIRVANWNFKFLSLHSRLRGPCKQGVNVLSRTRGKLWDPRNSRSSAEVTFTPVPLDSTRLSQVSALEVCGMRRKSWGRL